MATTVRRLIEKAAQSMGSDTRVAERLGVSRQRLSDWKTGFRDMPLERLEHLALLAGEQPERVIGLVAVERYRLGKRLATLAIIALAASASLPGDASAKLLESTRCTLRAAIRALRGVAAALSRAPADQAAGS